MINYYLLNSAFGKHGGEPVGGKPQFINRLVAVPFWTVKSTSYQQHSETGVRLERLSSSPPQLVCSKFRVFCAPSRLSRKGVPTVQLQKDQGQGRRLVSACGQVQNKLYTTLENLSTRVSVFKQILANHQENTAL